jgi:two-component system chemotaxis response regulator CheY
MNNKIMIVDDEPFIHQLYRDILEYNGYTVMAEAYDGEEAINIYRTLEERPDVLIMDHRMPRKDGVEATIRIKEMDPAVKVIFASADTSVRSTAFEAGAVDFLAKPFQIRDLMSSIQKASG